MKMKIILSTIGLLGLFCFGSCKKDYVCTCTTVIGSTSGTQTHDVKGVTYTDAKDACNNYENQANNTYPGGTTCHL